MSVVSVHCNGGQSTNGMHELHAGDAVTRHGARQWHATVHGCARWCTLMHAGARRRTLTHACHATCHAKFKVPLWNALWMVRMPVTRCGGWGQDKGE